MLLHFLVRWSLWCEFGTTQKPLANNTLKRTGRVASVFSPLENVLTSGGRAYWPSALNYGHHFVTGEVKGGLWSVRGALITGLTWERGFNAQLPRMTALPAWMPPPPPLHRIHKSLTVGKRAYLPPYNSALILLSALPVNPFTHIYMYVHIHTQRSLYERLCVCTYIDIYIYPPLASIIIFEIVIPIVRSQDVNQRWGSFRF